MGLVVGFESIKVYSIRLHSPIVEWIGPDGNARRFRRAGWTSWRKYVPGQPVRVLLGSPSFSIDPRVCIDNFAERYGFELGFLGFIIFVTAIFLNS
jgi:hypothetical protein